MSMSVCVQYVSALCCLSANVWVARIILWHCNASWCSSKSCRNEIHLRISENTFCLCVCVCDYTLLNTYIYNNKVCVPALLHINLYIHMHLFFRISVKTIYTHIHIYVCVCVCVFAQLSWEWHPYLTLAAAQWLLLLSGLVAQ